MVALFISLEVRRRKGAGSFIGALRVKYMASHLLVVLLSAFWEHVGNIDDNSH